LALWEGTSGRAVAELGVLTTDFQSKLAFSPDGGVVFAQDKQLLERWDLGAGRRTDRLPAPGRAHYSGRAVHPSRPLLLTGSGDGQVRYWDSTTLSPVRALKWRVGKLHSLAVSPDGLMAAAGGDKGQVVVWDTEV